MDGARMDDYIWSDKWEGSQEKALTELIDWDSLRGGVESRTRTLPKIRLSLSESRTQRH